MDANIASIIVTYLGGPYFALALRSVNREWRALIPRPKRYSAYRLAMKAARHGDLQLCELAIARGAHYFSDIAAIAARGGHRAICELIIQHDKDGLHMRMVRNAAIIGRYDICDLVISRGYMFARESAVYGAARRGDVVAIARYSGYENIWSKIAKGAARGGHRAIYEDALKYVGQDVIRETLFKAARGGHYDICIYAHNSLRKPISSDDRDTMLCCAAAGG